MRFTLIFAGAVLAAPAAWAQCLPGSVPADGSVSCTGTDSDGFDDGSDRIAVTVDPGAVVDSGGDDAIVIDGKDTSLTNNGTVRSGDEAVRGGAGFTLDNDGTIEAGDHGVDTEGEDGLTLTNQGTITATGKAVRMGPDGGGGNGNHVTNASGALIESIGSEGIEGGDGNTIVNLGTIIAADDAIQIGQDSVVDNYGIIRSTGANEPQDGIDLDSGTVTNFTGGQILADTDAAIDFDVSTTTSEIDNAGEIRGEIGVLVEKDPSEGANTATQKVTNRTGGVIEGRSGPALDLGAGDDHIVLEEGSTLIGGVDLGADDDLMELLGLWSGDFGGALFDGGGGFDTVSFADYALADLGTVRELGDGLTLGLGGLSILVEGWEDFAFSDGTRSYAQIAALAPIPSPAGGVLLAGGLASLAFLRRR